MNGNDKATQISNVIVQVANMPTLSVYIAQAKFLITKNKIPSDAAIAKLIVTKRNLLNGVS